jgi:hypothetical protein
MSPLRIGQHLASMCVSGYIDRVTPTLLQLLEAVRLLELAVGSVGFPIVQNVVGIDPYGDARRTVDSMGQRRDPMTLLQAAASPQACHIPLALLDY